MSTLIENDPKEIAKILESTGRTILDVFLDGGTLEFMLGLIAKEINNKCPDPKGDLFEDKARKQLISKARTIASVSLRLDELGKDEVSKLKELPKKVDEGRRKAKAFFDEWKTEVRKPVTQWEAEQAKIKLLGEIVLAHEQALLDNVEWEVQKERERKALEAERIERERVLREEITAQVRQEIAQTVVIKQEPATTKELKNDDKDHKAKINSKVLRSLVNLCGIDNDIAKRIVIATAKNKIDNLKIIY